MNYDSFYDSLKSLGKLTFKLGDSEASILMPYVNENRKVSLLVETEEIFFENTEFEFESKKIFRIYEPYVILNNSMDYKKLFGSIFNQDENKINISKIGCPQLEFVGDKKNVEFLYDDAKESYDKILERIIIETSGHLNLSFRDTDMFLRHGITVFGFIEDVKEMYESMNPDKSTLVDNMCNKCDIDGYLMNYLNVSEKLYSITSVKNLI